MASSITFNMGQAASTPVRIIVASVDFTLITSYATGGHEDSVLSAALVAAGVGTNYVSLPMCHNDGSEDRWFKVNSADNKIIAYDTAGLGTQTTATDDMSGHTAIPVVILAY